MQRAEAAEAPDPSRRAAIGGLICALGAASLSRAAQAVRSAAASSSAGTSSAHGEADLAHRVGLELWTVRDLLSDPRTREDTLARVAALGFREIEPDHGPSGGYLGLSPRAFRSLLERLGLSMPSTHLALREGPDIDQRLEGLAIMGLRYVVIAPPGNALINIPGQMRVSGPAPTRDEVHRDCEQLNRYGRLVSRHGMKIIVHNHTMEFAPLADDPQHTAYDILLRETDPKWVAMQLDIGWAAVAGQDILALFNQAPGRFELWHVKDASNIKLMARDLNEAQRQQLAQLVPVGLGDVDYAPLFAHASLAGLKHFCVEQDNAAAWGDSLAAARVSYENLQKLFTGTKSAPGT